MAVVKERKSRVMVVRGRSQERWWSEGGDHGGRWSEEVMDERGQREEVRGSRAKGRGGKNIQKEPLLSKRVSPGKGASGLGSSPRDLVRGSVERGTAWLWGSGQEALIHPRTRSAFFSLLTKNQGKKTGVNRLMRPEQLCRGEGTMGPRPAPSP